MKRPRQWLLRTATWTAVLMLLAAVFMAYTRPDFLLTVANQIWACF
jgi:hypothetical protein